MRKSTKQVNLSEVEYSGAIANALLQLADSIPGYSRGKLLDEFVPHLTDRILYTRQDVAKYFKVSVSAVKAWQKENRLIPSIRPTHGFVRFTIEDIQHFMYLKKRLTKDLYN